MPGLYPSFTEMAQADLGGSLMGTLLEMAEDLIAQCFLDGVNTPLRIKKIARECGISWSTVKKAKKKLQIVSVYEGMPARVVRWEFEDEERNEELKKAQQTTKDDQV
jgi:Mn-dependent DtxR family transcriptional regulator